MTGFGSFDNNRGMDGYTAKLTNMVGLTAGSGDR